jgi:DNA-directed RNA polymerase I subunit RPA1
LKKKWKLQMNIASPTPSRIAGVAFSFFNTRDIEKLSVCNVTDPQLFDSLGHPVQNGLYDTVPRL